MRVQLLSEARKIFELNAEQFPESSNAYDSLAESCMHSEKIDEAIKYYEKSLELNPENTNAKLMIQKLSEK
jgi:tetratricopeptide (TPR) repeat protein